MTLYLILLPKAAQLAISRENFVLPLDYRQCSSQADGPTDSPSDPTVL